MYFIFDQEQDKGKALREKCPEGKIPPAYAVAIFIFRVSSLTSTGTGSVIVLNTGERSCASSHNSISFASGAFDFT
jgi:hypothetical protein